MNELRILLAKKIESMGYWGVVKSEITQTVDVENVVNAVCDTIADYLKSESCQFNSLEE